MGGGKERRGQKWPERNLFPAPSQRMQASSQEPSLAHWLPRIGLEFNQRKNLTFNILKLRFHFKIQISNFLWKKKSEDLAKLPLHSCMSTVGWKELWHVWAPVPTQPLPSFIYQPEGMLFWDPCFKWRREFLCKKNPGPIPGFYSLLVPMLIYPVMTSPL
jgi:hypothetical protein